MDANEANGTNEEEVVGLNDPLVVEELRELQDADAIGHAYRAELIDRETALSILPKAIPSKAKFWSQAICEALDAIRGRSR